MVLFVLIRVPLVWRGCRLVPFGFRGWVAPCLCSGRLARFPLGAFWFRGWVAPWLLLPQVALFCDRASWPWFHALVASDLSFCVVSVGHLSAVSLVWLYGSVLAWYLSVQWFVLLLWLYCLALFCSFLSGSARFGYGCAARPDFVRFGLRLCVLCVGFVLGVLCLVPFVRSVRRLLMG